MKKYSDYKFASVSMSTDQLFKDTVAKLFVENDIKNIVESGTFMGLGSTTLLANAIIASNKALPNFRTLEVDEKLFNNARKNLSKFPFVTCKWGISVTAEDAIAFIKKDDAINQHEKYPDVFIDDTENPVAFYVNEVNGQLSKLHMKESFFTKLADKLFSKPKAIFEEGIFDAVIPSIKKSTPLFLLDSAGGLGYLEFQKVHTLMDGYPYFLILDDIHHLKHFRSLRDIQANTNFTIIEKNLEHGWVIAKFEKK
jgi:hypothetical protein